jgi:hypothetical protein
VKSVISVSIVNSMTRPNIFLKSKLVTIHNQSATSHLLRPFLGNQHQRLLADNASSAHFSPPSLLSSSWHRDPLRIRASRNSHFSLLCENLPARTGARPFSQFGNTAFQTPDQRSRTRHGAGYIDSKQFLKPKQSSTGSWTAVIVIGLFSGAILYSVSPSDVGRFTKSKPDVVERTLEDKDQFVGDRRKMTGETVSGRPGTLTAVEEEKLREFWIATLQVFGALDGQEAEKAKELNGNGHAEPGITRTGTTEKPKKKRFGLIRKKDKSDKGDDAASTKAEKEKEDTEDKYGQTKEFHDALASMSPELLRATFWSMVKHDHPDALLLRFLRARKWDVEKALVMMVSTMRWRSSEMHVDDDIMLNGEMGALQDAEGSDPAKKKLGNDFLTQMRMGKSFLHGLDKEGRPMCFVRVRLHKQGEQSEESLERYTVFVIESARMILSPPVDTAVSLVLLKESCANFYSALCST